jgi:protein-tyrosine kinase
MSRVHDALRRAAGATPPPEAPVEAGTELSQPPPRVERPPAPADAEGQRAYSGRVAAAAVAAPPRKHGPLEGLLEHLSVIPYRPLADALLLDPNNPHDAPAEEFRTLRTRINHMQSLQPIHTVVVTSPSPAEGKSFTAMNLAMAQAQLAGNAVLLCDFDFRRPIVHNLLQTERAPGITDYLLGKVPLEDAIRRVGESNLYIMPAGEAVINPLELLNLTQVKVMLDQLPSVFNWVILDSPPLLFAADANLLSTLCHGTVLVVRIGATTIDSVSRAMQSLCQNNVLGIVVNGARRGELYSKYTYYHSYYTPKEEKEGEEPEPEEES